MQDEHSRQREWQERRHKGRKAEDVLGERWVIWLSWTVPELYVGDQQKISQTEARINLCSIWKVGFSKRKQNFDKLGAVFYRDHGLPCSERIQEEGHWAKWGLVRSSVGAKAVAGGVRADLRPFRGGKGETESVWGWKVSFHSAGHAFKETSKHPGGNLQQKRE